jgi:phospholipid/cholesterol/gamma-HCH transport system ATP-binding protein
MTTPLIVIKNLTFKRGERLIFDDISITIPKGKITAIMGPSGSGKTTLLRLIGAEIKPDSGSILIDGENWFALSTTALCNVRKSMGLLFQSAALFSHLTVFENVAFPLRAHFNLSDDLIHEIVLMKLEIVGLRGASHLKPSSLSGGMARRVALARAIALDPMLVMYDEPFAGQDPISMGVLMRLIKTLNELLGLTSVIVSHDVREVCEIADVAYLLSSGKMIAEGSPVSLLDSSDPSVKQFMHGEPDGIVPFHYPRKAYDEDLFQ